MPALREIVVVLSCSSASVLSRKFINALAGFDTAAEQVEDAQLETSTRTDALTPTHSWGAGTPSPEGRGGNGVGKRIWRTGWKLRMPAHSHLTCARRRSGRATRLVDYSDCVKLSLGHDTIASLQSVKRLHSCGTEKDWWRPPVRGRPPVDPDSASRRGAMPPI